MAPHALLPTLTAGSRAPAPRTLVDIFEETVEACPDDLAVDNGVSVLTYRELDTAARELADRLAGLGIGRGSRVGVRVRSGTTDLYVAILGTLLAGAAYVPVDAEDPADRARTVFSEAQVEAVVGNHLEVMPSARGDAAAAGGADPSAGGAGPPTTDDDAWIIFTSGSTGTPKGVAVTHRNAAAFVDAESRIFLQDKPIGPGDRVMAGLSVAFDASCEEMWLAWAHGGCLVPAPRSLVRSGVDVGPWLVANDITVVSTVPTLVALWPPSALDAVRLLILGGEAAPAELAARLQRDGREVWNTYGPTEATVVACGTLLDGSEPIRIGLPLDGWDLAVVDADGEPVAEGETGELVIGGVGLARYLDPVKDAEKYAPMPTLGWPRAYRSGDVVRNDAEGLVFAGRQDDQIKLGGRRIELGEIDGQLLRLPGVHGAAAAVRGTASGNRILVGYLTVDERFDADAALALLRERMPAALVPRLAVVDTLPTRTSGKVDRDALPWPLPKRQGPGAGELSGTQAWLADIWRDVLAADATSETADFFDFGGGSLTAAQTVGRIRERFPEVAVGDVYAYPTIGSMTDYLEALAPSATPTNRKVKPIRFKTQLGQMLAIPPLLALAALRWLAWIMLGATLLHDSVAWLPAYPWWLLVVTTVLLILPPGRMALSAGAIRIVLRGVEPGEYPRGGRIHLRLWLAERLQDAFGATSLAGAVFFTWYARLLGCRVGRGVDLHALPPVTGFLRIGGHASIEPEVDLSGTWVDGDVVHLGVVRIGAWARVGARSTLGAGASVGKDAEVAPGSFVDGRVDSGEYWSGAPAERVSRRGRGPWTDEVPPRGRAWLIGYAVASLVVSGLPWVAAAVGSLVVWARVRDTDSLGAAVRQGLPWVPVAGFVGFATLLVLVLLVVRLCGLLVAPGHHPVRSAHGIAIWATMRVLDDARDWLFPLYAGALTPLWLRLLGTEVGRGVEASTVALIPKLTEIGDHAFLADDTLVGGYELAGGWIRVERVKVGKRAFLGNSGMAAPGRKIPKAALVAVLSAAPRRGAAKAGSSWMGSPPVALRRVAEAADLSHTYEPSTALKLRRALIETLRCVPLLLAVLTALGVGTALLALLTWHLAAAVVLGWVPLLLAGIVAALVAAAAKWVLVGRHTVAQHPLWSGFVWRNELADTFTEVLAARWFCPVTLGTLVLNVWFRMLGARIGDGVWCDSYWLPETDLVELGDGATVNAGCVVQTHLFHDRVLSMERVVLQPGATLGPNSVILPAASIGRNATVGPASLVMRGESVPSRTRWIGNPIGPWEET
ncbi:Amino acid adenylation enzyme/thioester reductase family protein [Nostocoides japonicum T1-X7]|uniref:Amino acid adenylation enzyme/thioester reductase family protein n=1 Tax=Nostocoides japonicum T1-X7 TaxID=1194083 RepID=A0A077LSU6_9MICO|nr:Pls/PosA family non-ribosomal peptide synthetase [Tetrasphaera japonica]CCH76268.1 Amino acid adenylation enzyme/thioester reductase family protein [Tetrasphaera japonica T1-X7]